MPELPDVEVARLYIESRALNQEVWRVDLSDQRVLRDVDFESVKLALEGRSFDRTSRHGKHLFVHLDGDGWLVLHFGMTGYMRYLSPDEESPEHTRMLIVFMNNHNLAYVSQRRLGKISLAHQLEDFVKSHELGPDALGSGLELDGYRRALTRGRGTIKSALMDQRRIAGIGNIYSDEVLFQAGIHPRTPVAEIEDRQLKRISTAISEVLKTAIEREADPSRFPQGYLLPHRKEGETCPRCGGSVGKAKIAGRTAYFCPMCQSN
jgi:formamidopyrimidine-DNA glycosylase